MKANEEVVRILKIDTGDSIETLAQLKKYVKDMKEGLEELEIGSEDYNTVLKALKDAQDAVKDSMHMGVEGIKAQKGSYNDLVHTMRELKEEWRATNDEAKRQELGSQINDLNSQLKNLDASVGVYGRNVGDYSNKFQEAFVAMNTKSGQAAAKGLKQFKLGLDAISKTPVIAILGALLMIIEKIVGALKSSEAGLESLTPAMGAFDAISEAVTKVLQGLGKAIAWVADLFAGLADKLGLVNDRMREKQQLAKDEIQLAKDQRAAVVSEAEGEMKIAEWRAKAQDREKYTLKQRMDFLDQAIAKENAIADERKRLADEELRIYEAQNHATDNAAEVEDKIAQLKAAAFNAEKARFETQRRLSKERNAIVREEAAAAKKAAEDAARAAKEAQRDRLAAIAAAIAAEKDYYTLSLSIAQDGSQEQLDLQNKIAALEYEKAVEDAKAKVKNAETLQKTLTALQDSYNLKRQKNQEAHDEKQRRLQVLELENIRDGYKKGSAAYLEAQINVLQEQYDTLTQKTGESDAEFLSRRIAAFRALQDAREAYADAETAREVQRRESELALLEDGSTAYLEKSIELKKYELDTLHQLEGESDDEFRARQLIAEKAYNDEHKKLVQARISLAQTWAGNISGLMGGIADAYEAMSDDQEKAAEETKGLRIAAAIIDTISGAVGAYMSAQNSGLPPYISIPLGVISAATVTAAGMANIAKMRAVNVKSGSGASIGATVSAPPVVQQVPVTRSLTSASEDDRLDRMARDQRVVLVYSDVKEADTYVEVVQSESEF